MTTRIDVLAVMDRTLGKLFVLTGGVDDGALEAREAVAELIEAAQEARQTHGFITFALDAALARIGADA